MADTLIIYGKEGCPHTTRARNAHPGHTYVNVKEDDKALQAMLELSGGVRKVPVIAKKTANGEELISVGFQNGA